MTDKHTKRLAAENIARAAMYRTNRSIERTCLIHISSFDKWDENAFTAQIVNSKPVIKFRIVSDGSGLDLYDYKNFRIGANPGGAPDSEVLLFDYTDFTQHDGLSNFLLGFPGKTVQISIGQFTASEPVDWLRNNLGHVFQSITGRTLG